MTITTYTNEPHGFGVTYDDARLACVDDPLDPRLAAAWSHRIHSEIAASALLTAAASTAEEIAAGTAFSVLITTDSAASGPHLLSSWPVAWARRGPGSRACSPASATSPQRPWADSPLHSACG